MKEIVVPNGINIIAEALYKRADRTVDRRLILNNVHWLVSILLNRKRRRLIIDGNTFIVNYYGLTIANSNTGKSYINSLLTKLLYLIEYDKQISEKFQTVHRDLNKKSKEFFQESFAKHLISLRKENSRQGIHKVGEVLSLLSPVGVSMNLNSDEFFSVVSDDMLGFLIEAYDGTVLAPIIKGKKGEESYIDIRDLPVNFYGMSSIEPLINNIGNSNFVTMLKTGLFRRSYIVNVSDNKVQGKESEIVDPTPVLNFVSKDLPAGDFELNKDAYNLFKKIKNEMIDKSNSDYFEAMRDPYKIIRLACIYAYGRGSLEVDRSDINMALEFERTSHQDAIDIVESEHDFIRTYMFIRQKPYSENELVRRKVLPASKGKREEILLDLKDYVIEKGEELITTVSNSGVLKYHIKRYSCADKEVSFSIGAVGEDKKPEGNFFEVKCKFKDISEYFNDYLIAPWVFNEDPSSGKTNRTKDNALYADMICFDFERQGDFYLTIDEAKHILNGYAYMLSTTKSHTESNHRFHIWIKLKNRLTIDSDRYKLMYLNIAKKLGIYDYIDKSTSHRASYFLEVKDAKERYFIDGRELDYECCIPETTEFKRNETVYKQISDVEFSNLRLTRYVHSMISGNVLQKGNRDSGLNTFVWRVVNDIRPPLDEALKAFDLLAQHIELDSSFTESNLRKYRRRLESSL